MTTTPDEEEFARTIEEYKLRFCRPEGHMHGDSDEELLACVLQRRASRATAFALTRTSSGAAEA